MTAPRRLSAGIAVVHETQDGARFLLLRAYRNWDFPKGLVEPGEDLLTAAIRETKEETGIADLDFAWGHDYIETRPYGNNKVARYYLARTAEAEVSLGVNQSLGHPEHHEYRWADLGEALRLAPPRIQPVVTWAAAKIMEQYKLV